MMTCDTARTLLAFRRPGGPPELPPEDLAALDGHLAGCVGCAAAARKADAFDTAVAAAFAKVLVPSDLRADLLKQLDRRSASRWWRRAGGVAAAAVVLLAVIAGYGVLTARPVFDADAVAGYHDELVRSPDAVVSEWLRAEGLPPDLPLPADFRNYAFHGTEPLMGRNVPVVVFQIARPNGLPETLKLYILRDRDFRLDALADARGSFYAARVLRDDRATAGVVYLAVYNTSTLDPFLKRGGVG
ncbi:MAG: hypothetical protein ACRC7O_03465 [Fimbriiglobus sp.]